MKIFERTELGENLMDENRVNYEIDTKTQTTTLSPHGELEITLEEMNKIGVKLGMALNDHGARLKMIMRPEDDGKVIADAVPMETRKVSPVVERLMDHIEMMERHIRLLQSFTERLDT